MTYHGHVRNGKIELDDAAELPEGAAVELSIVEKPHGSGDVEPARPEVDPETASNTMEYDPNAPSIEEEIDRIMADVPEEEWDRLPKDLNEQLDHYLYGTPKR